MVLFMELNMLTPPKPPCKEGAALVLGGRVFCCGSKAVNDAINSGVNPPGRDARPANCKDVNWLFEFWP